MRRDLLFREPPLLLERQELGVVPLVLAQLTVAQREHAVDRTVEEWQVVADHQHGPAERLEFVEEPTLGGLVEVIGGFVEHHRLGLLVEHAHQVDPSALTPRERGEVLEQEVLFETEAVGESGHLGFGLVPPALAELFFQ